MCPIQSKDGNCMYYTCTYYTTHFPIGKHLKNLRGYLLQNTAHQTTLHCSSLFHTHCYWAFYTHSCRRFILTPASWKLLWITIVIYGIQMVRCYLIFGKSFNMEQDMYTHRGNKKQDCIASVLIRYMYIHVHVHLQVVTRYKQLVHMHTKQHATATLGNFINLSMPQPPLLGNFINFSMIVTYM